MSSGLRTSDIALVSKSENSQNSNLSSASAPLLSAAARAAASNPPAKGGLFDKFKSLFSNPTPASMPPAPINYGATEHAVVCSANNGAASSSSSNAATLRQPLLGSDGLSSSYYQAGSQPAVAASSAATSGAAAPVVTMPGYKHFDRGEKKDSALEHIRAGLQGVVNTRPHLPKPSAIQAIAKRPPLPTDLDGWEKLSKHELDNSLNDLEDFASLETAVVSALKVSDLKEQKTLLESKEVPSLEKQQAAIQALKNWLVNIDPNYQFLIRLRANLKNLQQAVLGQQPHQQPKLTFSNDALQKFSEEQAAKQQAALPKSPPRVPLPTEIEYWVKLDDTNLALSFTSEKFAASLTTIIQTMLKKLTPAHEQILLAARTRLPLVIAEQSNKFDRITKLRAWINNILIDIDQLLKIQQRLQRLIETPPATRATTGVVVPPRAPRDAQAAAAPASSSSSSSSTTTPAAAHPSSSAAAPIVGASKIELEKLSLDDWENLSEDQLFNVLETSKNIGILRTLLANIATTQPVSNVSHGINILTMEERSTRTKVLIATLEAAISRITGSQSLHPLRLEALHETLNNVLGRQQEEARSLAVRQQLNEWKGTKEGQEFAKVEQQEIQRRAAQQAADAARIAALPRPTAHASSSSGARPPLPTRTLLTTATAPQATGTAVAVMPVKQEEQELNLQAWAKLDEKQLEKKLNSRRAFALLRKAILVYAPKAPPVDQKSLAAATLFVPEDKKSRCKRIPAVVEYAIKPARQALAKTGDPAKAGELLNSLESKLNSILTRLEPPAIQTAAAPVASSSAPRAVR